MFTIVYSNNIQIFKNDTLVEKLPFGAIHTSLFVEKKKEMRVAGLREIADFYPAQKIFNSPIEPKIPPFKFQEQMIEKATGDKFKCGIFESPTGSGKTNTIACIIAKENKTTIVIVPTADLVMQTADRIVSVLGLEDDNVVVGRLGNGYKELSRPVLVTTWQSLQNDETRASVLDYGYNILISDETHRASANLLSSFVEMFKSRKKFGLTASAYRSKDEQMQTINGILGSIIHKVEVEELYANGFILRPTITRIEAPYSASVEGGIRMYYEQALKSKLWLRRVMVKELAEDQSMKPAMKGKSFGDMIYNPTQEDYILMCTNAINKRNSEALEKKRKVDADFKVRFEKFSGKKEDRQELELSYKKALQEISSVELGLAKKGIDIFIPRLNMAVDYLLTYLNKTNEAAAVLFNTVTAGEYVAKALMEAGFENVVLINGQEKNKSELIKEISKGLNKNYIAISTVQMLSEGTDMPSLRKVFVGSPTFPPFTSIERSQQIIGRSVRVDKNNPQKKPSVVFLDDYSTDGYAKKQMDRMWEIINVSFRSQISNLPLEASKESLEKNSLFFLDEEDSDEEITTHLNIAKGVGN